MKLHLIAEKVVGCQKIYSVSESREAPVVGYGATEWSWRPRGAAQATANAACLPTGRCYNAVSNGKIRIRGVVLVGITLLETHNLVKRYSGRAVVNEVSITINQRSIVGLLGRNGAGKTTTFRMIIGMVTPDRGTVAFEGRNITKLPMYKRARLGVGYLSQEPSIFQRLSVRDNLLAILETMSLTRAERIRKADMLIDRFGLREVAKSQGRFLSGGERRKLEIARAMVTDPSLILLDEPFSGVDPIAVQDLQEEIRQLVASGVSILITDHNVERTLEVANKAYIIDHGKVIAAGPPAEIIRDELVRKSYLGNTFAGHEFDEQ